MRAMHAALRRRLLVLLDCHDVLLFHSDVSSFGCRRWPHFRTRLRRASAKRQRQQQFVLDQRHGVERTCRPPAPRRRCRRRARPLRLRCCASTVTVRCASGILERREAPLAFEQHVAVDRDRQRRPARASVVPSMRHSTCAAPSATDRPAVRGTTSSVPSSAPARGPAGRRRTCAARASSAPTPATCENGRRARTRLRLSVARLRTTLRCVGAPPRGWAGCQTRDNSP